jgi:hypothetical protein
MVTASISTDVRRYTCVEKQPKRPSSVFKPKNRVGELLSEVQGRWEGETGCKSVIQIKI